MLKKSKMNRPKVHKHYTENEILSNLHPDTMNNITQQKLKSKDGQILVFVIELNVSLVTECLLFDQIIN